MLEKLFGIFLGGDYKWTQAIQIQLNMGQIRAPRHETHDRRSKTQKMLVHVGPMI